MFKNSVTIMKISGIPIRLHISFLLILPFFAVTIGNNIGAIAEVAGVATASLSLNPYWLGLILAILLFVSVALHELAHSFVARSRGIEIRDITLMLLGGVAQMEDEFEEPQDEVWMAFAGPLFSLVLGFLLLFLVGFLAGFLIADLELIMYYLGFMNIFLALFNLLPAFPSDGGRILRSLIARKTSYLRATKIATDIGKFFAFLFGFYGLMAGRILIILIAFFIYIGASQEYQLNVIKDTFLDFTVADLMSSKVSTVPAEMKVQELMEKMLQERHFGYPVVDEGGSLMGCVTLEDIEAVPKEEQQEREVEEIMTCEVIVVEPEEALYEAFKKLSQADIGRLMVMDEGELKGILTRSDIMKAYRLKTLKEKKIS
ncbi:M50 family metallopeptidase [Fuchsiella alkaliacetigena]|uniref:M50 family metallopeptidase n=1 Tax=Fuchsiella alkaliacetigena TaxID=957042 RepID=UPI00200AE7C6|nr:CBS domain-containing protein [Fuchsiella alkaliacetigena]MCK8825307.1 CBS domain-containing protein [Fuchsiella alkaliacetigena]